MHGVFNGELWRRITVSGPLSAADHHIPVVVGVWEALMYAYGSAVPSPLRSTPPGIAMTSPGAGVQVMLRSTIVTGSGSQLATAPALATLVWYVYTRNETASPF